MEKRISSRGIIINNDNSFYAMFRRKIKDDGSVKEYYVIPGGGIKENESLIENVIREMKEEFSVKIKVIGYLGKDESEDAIANFFHCEIVEGEPVLGGEELERCSENNYYEIRKISIEELNRIDISSKYIIMKAFNKEYEELKELN